MSVEKDPYSLEPSGGRPPDADDAAAPEAGAADEAPGPPDAPDAPDATEDVTSNDPGLPVEPPEVEPEPSSIRALDVCPNCGAPMREVDQVRCLRCDYDLGTMRVETAVAAAPVEAADEPDEAEVPLVRPVPGDPASVLVAAAVAGVVMLVGLLAGKTGLFVRGAAAGAGEADVVVTAVAWSDRFVGVGRWLVLSGLWTACGVGGVTLAARLLERPRGDLRLIAARVLAIVATAGLVRFTRLPHRGLEFIVEAVGELVVFVVLAMLLFRLNAREALTTATLAVTLFLSMYVLSQVVGWVT